MADAERSAQQHRRAVLRPSVGERRPRADTIEAVGGVRLLDVDPGADTNRTVVTFVGQPEDVAEAAFRAMGQDGNRRQGRPAAVLVGQSFANGCGNGRWISTR